MPDGTKIKDRAIDDCLRDAEIYAAIHESAGEGDRHLTPIIRKVEKFWTKRENDSLDAELGKSGHNVRDDEIRALKEYYESHCYEIRLKECDNFPENTGWIFVDAKSAEICYPKLDYKENIDDVPNHLRKHIIIAHEVGHLLKPHIKCWLDWNEGEDQKVSNDEDEVVASRYAEWILNNLSFSCAEAGRCEDYIVVSLDKLHEAIKVVMKPSTNKFGYDYEGIEYNPEKYIDELVADFVPARV